MVKDGKPVAAHRMSAPTSRVFLPVSVPLAVIGERLNSEVPARYSGNEGNPVRHGAVVNDTLAWSAHRGPIFVWGDSGRLRLAVAAVGNATVHGRLRPVRGKVGKILRRATGGASEVPFTARANIHATVEAAIAPQLRDDWHVESRIVSRVVVHRADVPIAGITRVSVRGKVRSTLSHRVQALLARVQQKMRQDDRLHRLASREWSRLHKAVRISDDPATWLLVRPMGVAATPIRTGRDEIRFGLGIDLETSIIVTGQAPSMPAGPLPPLAAGQKQPTGVELHVPAQVSWHRLSELLRDRLPPQLAIDGGVVMPVRHLEIAPREDKVVLRLDLATGTGRFDGNGLRLELTARPRLDGDKNILYLDDLDFVMGDGHGGTSPMYQLIKPVIRDAIQRHAALDLSAYVQRAREKAEQGLAGLVADIPDGVELSAGIEEVSIGGLQLTADRLGLTVQVRAALNAAVTRLPF